MCQTGAVFTIFSRSSLLNKFCLTSGFVYLHRLGFLHTVTSLLASPLHSRISINSDKPTHKSRSLRYGKGGTDTTLYNWLLLPFTRVSHIRVSEGFPWIDKRSKQSSSVRAQAFTNKTRCHILTFNHTVNIGSLIGDVFDRVLSLKGLSSNLPSAKKSMT